MMSAAGTINEEKATSSDVAFLCHQATLPEHIPAGVDYCFSPLSPQSPHMILMLQSQKASSLTSL